MIEQTDRCFVFHGTTMSTLNEGKQRLSQGKYRWQIKFLDFLYYGRTSKDGKWSTNLATSMLCCSGLDKISHITLFSTFPWMTGKPAGTCLRRGGSTTHHPPAGLLSSPRYPLPPSHSQSWQT